LWKVVRAGLLALPVQECNTIQASVVNNVAHTRGPVFADDALVDATIAKAQQVRVGQA
jgi:hypothetical protein